MKHHHLAGTTLLLAALAAWARHHATGEPAWLLAFFSVCGAGILLGTRIERRSRTRR